MSYDDERMVSFDEEILALPDHGVDEPETTWRDRSSSNDERLLEERPPHWD